MESKGCHEILQAAVQPTRHRVNLLGIDQPRYRRSGYGAQNRDLARKGLLYVGQIRVARGTYNSHNERFGIVKAEAGFLAREGHSATTSGWCARRHCWRWLCGCFAAIRNRHRREHSQCHAATTEVRSVAFGLAHAWVVHSRPGRALRSQGGKLCH